MKKTCLLWICLLACLSTAFAQESPITLKTSTGEIKGTLTLPTKKKSKIPVVLLIAGSGPTDQNGNQPSGQNNSLKMIAEELGRQGIASLRFDKRGVASSQSAAKQESDLRFDHYVEDVKAWTDLLAKDKRFTKIIVAGHSEGSLIGMIACIDNKSVHSFISIAGAGRSADVLLKEQLVSQPDEVKDMVFPMLDSLKQGKTIEKVAPMLYALFRPSVQPYMISWFKYNPQTEIKKLTIPILILQGTTDIQVGVQDAELLASGAGKAEKKIITNMNHILKTCETMDRNMQVPLYSNPTAPLHSEFMKEFVNFLKK